MVCGFEMLARFASPMHAAPPDWFAAARHQARLGDLEAEVVAAGLAARHQVPPNCFLTINVSPDALVTPELCRVLHAEDQLEGLVFEVTEQTEVSDYTTLGRALGVLRGAGAMIAVDDAGAGYASLRHVMAIRPEFIKLDRELVTDVDDDQAKRALVDTMGTFAGRTSTRGSSPRGSSARGSCTACSTSRCRSGRATDSAVRRRS